MSTHEYILTALLAVWKACSGVSQTWAPNYVDFFAEFLVLYLVALCFIYIPFLY